MKIDWSELDRKMSDGLPSIEKEGIESIKVRIMSELELYSANPEVRDQFVKVRLGLRLAEEKALRKLGKAVVEPRHEGFSCIFCGISQSDVEFIVALNESTHLCSACLCLINELVEAGQ